MAKDGMTIMDSTMHTIEPTTLWQRDIDSAVKSPAPRSQPGHENPARARESDRIEG